MLSGCGEIDIPFIGGGSDHVKQNELPAAEISLSSLNADENDLHAAVLYDGSASTGYWEDTYSRLCQPLLLGFECDAVDISGDYSLEGYDILYPDESIMSAANAETLRDEITAFAENGGGVYVVGSSSTFKMTGGSITGNNAYKSDYISTFGGGVCVGSGIFTVSGEVTVTDNTKGGTKGADGKFTGDTKNNVYLPTGKTITIDDLFRDGYKSVFIGAGLWKANAMHIKGETLGNVAFGIDYLANSKAFQLGDDIAVIGVGNSAMDCARTAIRNGARHVTCYAAATRAASVLPSTR